MTFRAPVIGDAPAIVALLAARDIADLGAPDYTLEDLRDDWRASDFDLGVDALVVQAEDGSIVGYAAVLRPGTEAVVAPAHEGRGIGARLLGWAERRDRERGRQRHRQWLAAGNAPGRALLLVAGYRPERSYWRMTRQLDEVTDAGMMPVDVNLRALDVDADATAVHALNEASFAANSDYRPESFAAFCEEHLRVYDLAPALSCVAEQHDIPVGFLLARRRRDEDVGFVDLLAVHPDQRNRGLGSAMLSTAFTRFAAAGLREAQLGVA